MKFLFTFLVSFVCLGALQSQCNALFSWDDTDITIQFIDQSTSDTGDPIVSWFWDFDDNGNTSTQQNPTYTFSDADKYDVVLTITTQNGCTSSIEIEIETCVLTVTHTIGECDANGIIPVFVTINDPWDVAEEVDVILDGQSVPGSPFPITAASPINITVDVPGNGLAHVIQCQSIEIATCGKNIEFTVPDCSSDCFLSGLAVGYPVGITHNVDVGDDFFSPISVGIVLGDVVNFAWIGDGHSTTSDATSGADAWNSGVISIGSSFDVSIDNPGIHPYYCIPHGGPGGVGMSGEILANCPSGNSLDLDVSFNTTIADAAGYNIYYDGSLVTGSPFNYNGTGPQSQTISIAGDGLVHPLLIEDVNDPSCTLSMDYNAPDCDQGGGNPECSITVSLGSPSGCDANQNVMVDATIGIANGGTGFDLTIDGGAPTFYTYNGPNTTVSISLPGDGQSHTIAVTDNTDPTCTASTQITTPDCNLPCNITNLVLTEAGASGGITHTVNVEDFIFNPSIVNITTGDVVEWIWTGVVAHTSTSDATSGPDSWESGLLNNGDTYTSPVLSEGEHPYYCIPHGNPGGEGMAGTIFVLPPCNANGEVIVNVNFDITSNGTSGFEILVDGVVAGTFSYVGGSAQSASVDVPGDAMAHTIQVRDIDDNTCNASADITTGDCDGGGNPVCMISATSSVSGGCDANNQVPVDLVVTASDQGANFSVSVDGVSQGSFPYTGSTTNITINVDGDGMDHTITLADDTDPACTATTIINTPNCTLPCSITNLVVTEAGASGGTTHTVNVEDFIFNPSIVNITTGDVVEWIWTGVVAHTSTSDATSGPDSWESGLLNTGATYTSPVLSEGEHPYYCIPHGNPGGEGMAGTIFVLPPCDANGNVVVNVNFDITSNGASGFEVLVDGVVAGTFSYVGGSAQSASVDVPGDAIAHTIQVRDIDDNTCNASADITTGDCDGGGNPVCMISATSSVSGGCDANNQVPVDLVVTASDQGTNFSVSVDGVSQGSFPYTGSTTNITINVDGDGMDHTITFADDTDPACTATTIINTPNCTLPCSITNLVVTEAGASGGTTHTVNVEDFIFNPSIVNITTGDVVEWVWTGAVAHTSTSDATSGPDSWESGLLNTGATYTSPVLSEGEHPYYCIPHGNPGGEGMAGTIFVLPPCDANGNVVVNVNFDITSNGASGFEVLVDGVVAGTFSYVGGSAQSASVDVPGDAIAHTIQVRDIDDNTCNASADITTGDCDGGGNPVCMISATSSVSGGCDANNQVPVDLVVTASDQGANFSVSVDGVSQGSFPYTGSTTNITINVDGDGMDHTITLADDTDPACTATTIINTPNCTLPCSITNLVVTEAGASGGTTHTVNVEDFIFNPSIVNITTGDVVEWVWTGAVAHTSTSDATSGPDSWESGLLNTGATYTSPVLSEGEHPYYCIPHGNPGGEGMAGTIFVLPPCDANGNVVVNVNFDITSNGASGFEVLVDGVVAGTFSYVGGSAQSASVDVPGDAMAHTIQVRDIDDNTCNASADITTGDCDGGGNPVCMISATSSVSGGCDANNQVPVDLIVTASDQGTNFSVSVDGVSQGSFPYTGSTTNITINVDGDGMDHAITLADDTDPACTATSIINTPNCTLPCSITNLEVAEAGASGGTTHTVNVEDFIFNPSIVNITTGDVVEWVWTGAVAHTSTSDATSGPDSWESGLLNTGATYTSPVLSEGEHPYYCIPHGNPGGEGMAGTIFVLPPCDANGNVVVNVNFDITSNGASGFEVLVDGVVAGTFSYVGGSAQSASVDVPGDAIAHTIQVRDIDDNTCNASADITTGDCGGGGNPMCSISATSAVSGGCDANNQVPVDLVVTASDQGANFSVSVDGVSQGTFPYTGSTTNITINVDGDGLDHTITLTDDVDPVCTTSTVVNTPNCTLPCSITNLVVAEAGASGGTTHTVNVEDYIFNPSIVNITSGDVVEWIWTGVVAHTSTSDATSGPDSWESGLLNTGATFTSPVLSEGEHPYYCIPHGSSGGVGMAGTIFVLPPCNANGEVLVNVNFDVTSNGTSGFEVLVDGVVVDTFSYVGGAAQSASVDVPGDAMIHTIEVRDVSDNACNASADITTGDCDGGGNPMCSISATSSVSGGCDANNQVPVDLVVTASDQGANFSVSVDGVSQGTFPYTGSTTNITINVDGDGLDHTIILTDDVDSTCTTSSIVNTTDCSASCTIDNIKLTFSQNTTHVILVEDFEFNPNYLNITIGDTILFDWVGVIPHTATSDVSSGIDAFDSGLLSQGATYSLILNSIGDHPYYCIPHGAPGGIGMAGTISVQAACEGENCIGNLSFNYEGSSGDEFKVSIDGSEIPESPIPYNPLGSTNTTITVPGDNMEHTLVISDSSNSNCSGSMIFISPDSGDSSCTVSLNLNSISECDGPNVQVDFTVSSTLTEALINFYKDGILLNTSPLTTDDQGNVEYVSTSIGNGIEAEYSVSFPQYPDCTDSISVSIPDCNVPCLVSDLIIGEQFKHIVEVRDFDFFPASLEVLVGDTVRFVWTGVVPHTSTSDAEGGDDSWDSELLEEGDSFEIVINNEGEHPYYCIPHGGPNGIGMSGLITAKDTCDGDNWLTVYSFSVSAGSPLGYNIFLDGDLLNANPIPYTDATGFNQAVVALPGDADSHLFTIQDVETDFCAFTTNVITGQCGADCTIKNLSANVGASVIHEVEVRDFDFLPSDLTVRVGETVRFIWTGAIPHTSTSDAISGDDSWDSGLLNQGDTFDIILQTIGDHPYYCIPHGGPGGIGQSGVIHALPQCQDGDQQITINFDAKGGSIDGYKLFVDGNIINNGLNPYQNTTGPNSISFFYPADGLQHIATVQDADNTICAASAFYQSEDCSTDCEIDGLSFSMIQNKDTVLVRDFDFLPLDITIEAGDTIFFDWVGIIPHTVTSDAINGTTVFNSGLLQQGDSYMLVINEIGEHPYYCIPHGGPDGIGMAGNITVVDPCDDEEILADFSFTTSRVTGTYNVLLNGNVEHSNRPYSGQPQNHFKMSLPADQSAIEVSVIDQVDNSCMTTLVDEGINCSDPCFGTNADFDFDINFATMEVSFSDVSSGDITSWNWDFGDGSTSNLQNPNHVFADPIVYEVCLSITQDDGCTDEFCDKVRFSNEVCIAGFTYEQNDLELIFTNTSDYEDPSTEILWTFGDGDISNEINSVGHLYELGLFTVCIQISSDSCVANYCEDIDLSNPCLTISPDFEVVKDGEELTVMFNDMTTGSPDSWLWGFGDGVTSTEQNPTHTFEEMDLYNICLFVQESENSCSKSYCKTISVGTTGVTEVITFKPLNIFPNPSSENEIVYISGFGAADIDREATIEIFDVNGRSISRKKERIKEIHPINKELLSGVFIIRITAGAWTYSGMFVKQ